MVFAFPNNFCNQVSTSFCGKFDADYHPSNAAAAMQHIMRYQEQGEIATGLLYLNVNDTELKDKMHLVDAPLNALPFSQLRPGADDLEKINNSLR